MTDVVGIHLLKLNKIQDTCDTDVHTYCTYSTFSTHIISLYHLYIYFNHFCSTHISYVSYHSLRLIYSTKGMILCARVQGFISVTNQHLVVYTNEWKITYVRMYVHIYMLLIMYHMTSGNVQGNILDTTIEYNTVHCTYRVPPLSTILYTVHTEYHH